MKKNILLLLLVLFGFASNYAQEETVSDSIEVNIIDQFVTPDSPQKFLLSFFTGDTCKSKVVITGKGEYVVSKEFTDNHKIELDISGLKINNTTFTYYLLLEKASGKIQKSEKYEAEMPVEQVVENRSNFLSTCLFGGIVFLTPSPTYVYSKNGNPKELFSLSKEIPIVSFFSGGYNYPVGYFSAEYAHIFKSDSKYTPKNSMRIGYKHIIEIPVIEYVSPGISWFTNFKGFNGISAEASLGLFNMYNVFTVYAKYRFSFQPDVKETQFHEISIGLFSSFFSLHL